MIFDLYFGFTYCLCWPKIKKKTSEATAVYAKVVQFAFSKFHLNKDSCATFNIFHIPQASSTHHRIGLNKTGSFLCTENTWLNGFQIIVQFLALLDFTSKMKSLLIFPNSPTHTKAERVTKPGHLLNIPSVKQYSPFKKSLPSQFMDNRWSSCVQLILKTKVGFTFMSRLVNQNIKNGSFPRSLDLRDATASRLWPWEKLSAFAFCLA